MNDPIEKYLSAYAEPESGALDTLADRTWQQAVAVPARREQLWLPSCLKAIGEAAEHANGRTLCILILNGEREAALQTWNSLGLRELVNCPKPLSLSAYSEKLEVLCVNRTGDFAFPEKQGVGLARKIGCDIALSLYTKKQLSASCVHTTDADVQVPIDYFNIPFMEGVSAYLYPFRHRHLAGGSDEAHDLYEAFLHYYVKGLRRAGSPYAFHTVGSTLVLSLPHYAVIRGFPKREAAEDFYVLNKLAKVGRIESLTRPVLEIRPRSSDRVPFGTGQATGKLATALERGEVYQIYDPRVFDCLGIWIKSAESYCRDRDSSRLQRANAEFYDIITLLGGPHALDVAWETRSSEEDRLRHFHTWFDAFRTLRLVHLLTERYFKKIPYSTAIAGDQALLLGL
ncbi:MAG: hypothetical protein KDD39_03170 [Bdellovibrionales bacterium]|nr:hypothetical protein [Bdellovibrionales bacterium]